MMDGMEKDATFKCPNCGSELSVESKNESDTEHKMMAKKPASKPMNAGTMPMNDLKSKISSGPTMGNLNSY